MRPPREFVWETQAVSIARTVLYTVYATSGTVQRSGNSEKDLGIASNGTVAAWPRMIAAEDRSQYEDALRRLSRASPAFEVEYRVRHALTSREFWVLDRGQAEFDADGKLVSITGAIIDVSARHSVERELRKAVRLRTVVFEAGRMAAWHFDAATGRFTCSDELLELLEIDRAGFDDTSHAVEAAIHPGDRDAWRRSHESTVAPGGRMEIEFRVMPRHGGMRWLLSRGEIVRNIDGVPLESYGVMIDITDRKASEEAGARLAAIVASSEDAIISKTLYGMVTSWNRSAERLFGHTAGEMTGESIRKLIPDEIEHEEINILSTIRTGQSIPPYETVRRHKSGRMIHVSISVSPILNARGDVVGASTIARDVTERRLQNERLRENEARLRLALKSARAGAWDYDLVRGELHWSPEMFALYGLDPAKGQPTREEMAACIAPAHRSRAQAEFSKATLQGGSFTLEFPIIRPDGSEIWTALAGDVIKDVNGRPVSARGIDQDITERKGWEERQAILLRELSHRVKNTLAVIQSVSRQTLRLSASPADFVRAFEGRIHSLATSHSLLTEADWGGARVDAIIRNQTAGMDNDFGSRFRMRGPDVTLTAESATQFGLVLHELATNALKYGALSVPDGHVEIEWTATKTRLSLCWRECNGPVIDAPPEYEGFGTLLITTSALKVERQFKPAGLVCKLQLAL
ncbi:PAS domain-containing protein [Aestuariivirga sp.]|uniref:PAS domain-containing sensor histidine kinase n=1 Tax=Aestuariivirga sp. TaxID=2650926 RepID=UPI0035943AE1